MEEKKLTDEEIVKALDNCVNGDYKTKCKGCPYDEKADYCKVMDRDTLDLIHRLQGEIERLTREKTESAKTAVEVLEQNIELQKQVGALNAEIERLTKRHERIAWSKQEYLEWVHGFLSTHTDMKDRGEKFEMFDRDWMCNVFWEKIVGALEYIIDLENQRNELQSATILLEQRNKEIAEQKEEIERLKIQKDKAVISKDELQEKLISLNFENKELQKQVDECNRDCEKYAIENGELQQQINELKSENTVLYKERTTLIAGSILQKQDIVKDTSKKIEDKIQELLDTPFEGKTEKQKYQRKGMEEGLKIVLEIVRECKGVEVE